MKLLSHNSLPSLSEFVKVVYPLKQGLKLIESSFLAPKLEVKVVYPLKQGLKQSRVKVEMFILQTSVKVVYPLKQGLKPFSFSF